MEKKKSEKPDNWWMMLLYPAIETALAIGLLAFMFFKITAKALYRRLIGKGRKEAKINND